MYRPEIHNSLKAIKVYFLLKKIENIIFKSHRQQLAGRLDKCLYFKQSFPHCQYKVSRHLEDTIFLSGWATIDQAREMLEFVT
jgi:hypothetical protein